MTSSTPAPTRPAPRCGPSRKPGATRCAELRRLLAAVRPDGTESPAPPQAGLDRVAELAEPLRAAGLEVVVTHEGQPATLPAGVDLSAYRIVQEALTNTLRHARATVAEVTFRHAADALEIDVIDNGRAGARHASATAPGYGLIGMRERAALCGGTLEPARRPHGGYRVRARIPLEAAP